MNSYDLNSEFADIEDEAQAAIANMDGQRDTAASLSEAQRRIRLAMYFEAFLSEPLFTNRTPEAEQAESELREYAVQRMEVLLGMRAEFRQQEPQFNDQQVDTLREWADRLISGAKAKAAEPPKPVVRQIANVRGSSPATEVAIKPAPPKIEEPAPKVRKRTVKGGAFASAPASAAPAVAPATGAPSALIKAAPAPKQQRQPAKVSAKYKTADTAADGEPFIDNGQRYIWERNDNGERYRKNITGQVRNPMAAPIPTGPELEFLTASKAAAAVQSGLNTFQLEVSNPKSE